MPRKRSAWAPLLAVEVSAEWRAAAPFLAEVVGRALVEYLEPDTRSTYDTATWSYVDFCTSNGVWPWPVTRWSFCLWMWNVSLHISLSSLTRVYMGAVKASAVTRGDTWTLNMDPMVRRVVIALKKKWGMKSKPRTAAMSLRVIWTLAQRIPTAGAVIVTTPQDIALLDARRALHMFRKVGVPVLGVVENMSTHICTACGHEEAIFGQGGGEQMAIDFEIPLLGKLPLAMEIRSSLDEGNPTVVKEPDSQLADSYRSLALRTTGALSVLPRSMVMQMPEIVIQN
jgi:hypothetical protein